MSDNELDEAERRAIEMVEFFQEECRKQCAPYLKIISDIRALRPRIYVMDGKTMVPFLPSDSAAASLQPAADQPPLEQQP